MVLVDEDVAVFVGGRHEVSQLLEERRTALPRLVQHGLQQHYVLDGITGQDFQLSEQGAEVYHWKDVTPIWLEINILASRY